MTATGAAAGNMALDAATPLPRISIVTPSLNRADYLEETLLSVLGQGYPNLEYVVVDGGSVDESASIIARHQDAIAYWVSEPDQGHGDALNKGFAFTTGEIMGWINSTDIYYPWTLAIVADVFRDLPEVDWIEGIPTMVDDGARPKSIGRGFCNRNDLLLGDEIAVQQESVFWRRSLWEKAGGQIDASLRLACDYQLWLRFSRHAVLYHVDTFLAGFRTHDDRRGFVFREDFAHESKRVRSAELASLKARQKAQVAVLRCVRVLGGRRLSHLVARTRLIRWHRHSRIVYDFSHGKWRIA
jgi:glycosyltransferase involved in cell wall biosynthesis